MQLDEFGDPHQQRAARLLGAAGCGRRVRGSLG
jgi:hypothetical protein